MLITKKCSIDVEANQIIGPTTLRGIRFLKMEGELSNRTESWVLSFDKATNSVVGVDNNSFIFY